VVHCKSLRLRLLATYTPAKDRWPLPDLAARGSTQEAPLLLDLAKEHGEPTAKEKAWARRVPEGSSCVRGFWPLATAKLSASSVTPDLAHLPDID